MWRRFGGFAPQVRNWNTRRHLLACAQRDRAIVPVTLDRHLDRLAGAQARQMVGEILERADVA